MKKMLTMLAAVVAVAFSATAATPWFDGKIETGWPTVEGMNGAWSNTTGCELSTDGVTVSASAEAPLTFTATDAKTVDGGAVKEVLVDMKVSMAPFTTLPEFGDAKAAFCVFDNGDGSYTYHVLGSDQGQNSWVPVTGVEAYADMEVAVKVTAEKIADSDPAANSITYSFGTDTITTTVISSSSTFQTVEISGDGTLASLAGEYDAATYELDLSALAAKNLEVDSVTVGGVQIDTPYAVGYGATAVVTVKPIGAYVITGSNQVEVGPIVSAAAAKVDVSGVTVEAAKVTDGTTYYISLKDALDANLVETGDPEARAEKTITIIAAGEVYVEAAYNAKRNATTEKAASTWNKVTIDLSGKTWALTGGDNRVRFYKGQEVTFKNGTIKAGEDYPVAKGMFTLYNDKTVFENVTIDATGITATTVVWTDGDLTFKGSSIVNVGATYKSLMCGDYAGDTVSQYVMGDLTFEGTCAIAGDVMFGGFGEVVIDEDAEVTFDEATKFYYAEMAHTYFQDSDVAALGFAARAGEDAAVTRGHDGDTVIKGQLYMAVADAMAALGTDADNYPKVKLLADAAAVDFTVPTAKTLEVGAYQFNTATLNGTAVLTSATQLSIADKFVAPATGYEIKESGSDPYSYAIGLVDYPIAYLLSGVEGADEVTVSGEVATYTIESETITITTAEVTLGGANAEDYEIKSVSGDTVIEFGSSGDKAVTVTVVKKPQGLVFTIAWDANTGAIQYQVGEDAPVTILKGAGTSWASDPYVDQTTTMKVWAVPADGYKLTSVAETELSATQLSVAFTTTQLPAEPVVPGDEETGAQYGITNPEWKDAAGTSSSLKAALKWATTSGKGSIALLNAAEFATDGTSVNPAADAYLLDCSVEGLATAKAAFKVAAISVDAEGNVEITNPTGTYNGTIETLGKTAIDAKEEWAKNVEGATVFKLQLVK